MWFCNVGDILDPKQIRLALAGADNVVLVLAETTVSRMIRIECPFDAVWRDALRGGYRANDLMLTPDLERHSLEKCAKKQGGRQAKLGTKAP